MYFNEYLFEIMNSLFLVPNDMFLYCYHYEAQPAETEKNGVVKIGHKKCHHC
jgi:hypothetical protein